MAPANVQRCGEYGDTGGVRTVADHHVQLYAHPRAIALADTHVVQDHLGDRVAEHHPVPGFLTRGELESFLLCGDHLHVPQSRGNEALPQDEGVGDLELQRRRVRQPLEVGGHGLQGGDEESQRVELRGRAVADEQDTTPGLGHPHHLAQGQRLVRDEHHPELGPGHIEALILEIESVSVHHPRRRVGQTLRARSRLELGHHLR